MAELSYGEYMGKQEKKVNYQNEKRFVEVNYSCLVTMFKQ